MQFPVTPNLTYMAPATSGALGAYLIEMITALNEPFLFRAGCRLEIDSTVPGLITSICEQVERPFIRMIPLPEGTILEFDRLIISMPRMWKQFEKQKRTFSVTLHGEMGLVEKAYNKLNELFPPENNESIDWFYAAEGKIQKSIVELSHKNTPHDEFFPWIKPDVASFQKAYLESDANILLLIGEPGCGKTSFIRDMIRRNNLSSAVTYDENAVSLDQFFIEFMNRSYDLLVIEDADAMLHDRSSGNKVMNKLLNSGDGLIQTKKKIVMTANITHLDEIDTALIRPGRCFETLIFRELTQPEAAAAARAAGLPEPDEAKTLAKLFSEGPATKVTSRLGFGTH